LTAGTIIAIDASAFVSALGQVEFLASEEAVIHEENATPLPIGTPGSPATVAAPVRSGVQSPILQRLSWQHRKHRMSRRGVGTQQPDHHAAEFPLDGSPSSHDLCNGFCHFHRKGSCIQNDVRVGHDPIYRIWHVRLPGDDEGRA
jgi:hypothetical protein